MLRALLALVAAVADFFRPRWSLLAEMPVTATGILATLIIPPSRNWTVRRQVETQ
jgi:hypothetical protein